MSASCQGINRDGTPCQARPFADQAFCPWHSPERQEALIESRRLGGQNKSREARAKKLLARGMDSLGDVNDVLKLAMLEVQAGRLDPKIANAMANLAGRIKDLSIGEELERRIAELQRETGEIAGRIGA